MIRDWTGASSSDDSNSESSDAGSDGRGPGDGGSTGVETGIDEKRARAVCMSMLVLSGEATPLPLLLLFPPRNGVPAPPSRNAIEAMLLWMATCVSVVPDVLREMTGRPAEPSGVLPS